MGRLSRAAGWGAARLLPPERREWAEAIWAEADEIPSALRRLNWYVGGAWLVAKEPIMVRRVGNAVLFAGIVALMASAAWEPTTSNADTLIVRALPVATVVVMISLSKLARRLLGPVLASPIARALRTSMYVAATLLIVAVVGIIRMHSTRGRLAQLGAHNHPSVGVVVAWSLFLVALAAYVAVVLAVTAQRSWVRPRTLAIGTLGGILLGATMYAIMPLGVWRTSTAPWLRGTASDPLVVFAWVVLLIGPAIGGFAAGWWYSPSGEPLALPRARIRQANAAGTLMTIVGSLIVCVLGLLTLAELPHAAWLAQLMDGGHHLSAVAAAHRAYVLSTSSGFGYVVIWLVFPLVGLGIGALAGNIAWDSDTAGQEGNGPGGGCPEDDPGPVPSPVGEPQADEPVEVAVELVSLALSGT